jgi:hypothetical protein
VALKLASNEAELKNSKYPAFGGIYSKIFLKNPTSKTIN